MIKGIHYKMASIALLGSVLWFALDWRRGAGQRRPPRVARPRHGTLCRRRCHSVVSTTRTVPCVALLCHGIFKQLSLTFMTSQLSFTIHYWSSLQVLNFEIWRLQWVLPPTAGSASVAPPSAADASGKPIRTALVLPEPTLLVPEAACPDGPSDWTPAQTFGLFGGKNVPIEE